MSESEPSRLVDERRAKVARLRARGVEPYPWGFPGRVPIVEVLELCKTLKPGERKEHASLKVAGRVRAIRSHGKSSFVDLVDRSGDLQLYLRTDELGEGAYRQWLADLDPGDLLGASGVPLVTRRGEPSLLVSEVTLLAKALQPPPEKYHGLKDMEERLRRRHVELLASGETRRRFTARSLLTRELRRFLDDREFLEVETPTLVQTASGATAAPFITRSSYLDAELKLRISLELPLKRLLVGGLERVYEVGRVFRNEDMDTTHSPEFTMLELYWAYADYHDMRHLVEELYERLARRCVEIFPDDPAAREAETLFHPPFAQVDYVGALEDRSGIPGMLSKSREELDRLARSVGSTVPEGSPAGAFLDKLFDHYVAPTLTRPTFVMDHPAITTPLAKRHRERTDRVERFELFYRGFELANAYTELNDPDEQAARFREQISSRPEAHYAFDEEFVEAIAFGMPPASGLGIGVDRMVMALTGISSIKEVILFPMTRRRT